MFSRDDQQEFLAIISENVRRFRERPVAERLRWMVERGLIDEEGNLNKLRFPEPEES